MSDQVCRLHIVSEAVTPHNNFLFGALGEDQTAPVLELRLYYIFEPTGVAERPWKKLSADVGNIRARTGIGRGLDRRLLWAAATAPANELFFIIGWNHPTMLALIVVLSVLKKPFFFWADVPTPSTGRNVVFRDVAKRMLIRLINRSPGRFFLTGRKAAESFRAMGLRNEKIENLPFFVPQPMLDEAYYEAKTRLRRTLGIDDATVVFLAAGRLIPSKGYDLAIEAVLQLKERGVEGFKLIVVGSGVEQDKLHKAVRDYGVDHLVSFIPWLEADELARYMQLCDVFVQPARFDPFPTVVLQALGHGKVVIASDKVFSAAEFIVSGQNGFLFPTGDDSELARLMETIIDDRHILARAGALARQTSLQWPVDRGVSIIKQAIQEAAERVRVLGE